MALQKQPININFAKGLDTKTDPNQIPMDQFTNLQNSIFDKAGRLTKRNGFAKTTTLPTTEQTNITTHNGNLITTGSNLYAYSQDTNVWLNQGSVQPVELNVLPLVRVTTSQTSPDQAVAPNGLACLAYVDNNTAYYQVSDSVTGQQIVPRTALPATSKNPRVLILGQYFIITFEYTVAGAPKIAFARLPIASPASTPVIQQLTSLIASIDQPYDVAILYDTLYLGWNGSDGAVKLLWMQVDFIPSSPSNITVSQAAVISMCTDLVNKVVWIAYWDLASTNLKAQAFGVHLSAPLFGTPLLLNTGTALINTMTSVASNGLLTVIYEVNNTYSYAPSVNTNYIRKVTATQAGVIGATTTLKRSVGLASKAFFDTPGGIYFLAAYGETNQPTYFLLDQLGNVYMKLAYANGGGYTLSQVLPSVSSINDTHYVPYLIKDFLATVNKTTNPAPGQPSNAIYTQTGINLAIFTINLSNQYSSEIAGALHLTGGQLWEYDGVRPVEHGFHIWPENVSISTTTGAGALAANTYYYQFCYEWTDNQGNLHRSAPSLPMKQITTTASSTNTIQVPTLRLTAKVSPNSVRIVGYRWSLTQQVYYQFTSITSPIINDTTIDSVQIIDTLSDIAILGQTLLYTTGGVIENIGAPASTASALFKNRLFIIDAENRNLLWFSKQVIENTPVEMSDLLTIYVAPTSGAQGSTGPLTALSAMDDKLIMFKKDAIYYLTGLGPDNTGANNDFTDPVYITASVGCANPRSIVLTPNGIMFQSDKGIWLLGRDLNTSYVGAPVERYNSHPVKSATAIPGTNQVRFVLDNNQTLMFDYYYNQWGVFSNLEAISATLYQGKHTYLNLVGEVYQETPGLYLDGSRPVLLSLTTAWINVAGLQGYERLYQMLFLGTYYSPFKLDIQLAYDFNTSAQQSVIISPDNYSAPWGGEANWGSGGPWGGPGNVFEARVFPRQQKCETFQITINEVYDSTYGVAPGQGLTLSGMNMVVGVKKGYRTQKASKTFG